MFELPQRGPYPIPHPSEWRRTLSLAARYRWLLVAGALGGLGAGFGLTRLVEPRYRAEATVWVEAGRTGGGREGGPVGPGQLLDSYAWIDLLKSYRVLDHAVREQGLYVLSRQPLRGSPLASFDAGEGFRTGSYRLTVDRRAGTYALADDHSRVLEQGALGDSIGRGLGFRWAPPAAAFTQDRIDFTLLTPRDAAQKLADRLDIRMDQGGNFLRIALSGSNPQQIAAILNTVTGRYVEVSGRLKQEKVAGLSRLLGEQLSRAQDQLRSSEEALRKFQQAGGTAASEASAEDPRVGNYLELTTGLDKARRDREAIEATLRQPADSGAAASALELIEAVQRSPALKGALDELASKRAELRSLEYRYTDAHPEVQRLEGEIRTLSQGTIPALARQLVDELRSREAQMERARTVAAGAVRAIPGQAIEGARLKRELAIAETLYTTLQQRYHEANLAEASSAPDVRILDAAVAPTAPVENTAARLILLGFAGGLGLAVAGAGFLARVDRRVRGPEQVGLELGLPLLGVIPHIRSRGKRLSDEQAAELVEALRGVRLSVLHAYGAERPVVLTVTSPGPGDGKSFISSRLALAFAEGAHPTVLVDADVRRGRLHHVLSRPRRPGLVDHLSGEAAVPDIIQRTDFGPLDFVACGTRHQDAPEQLASSTFRGFLATLRARYEVIIVDSAPMAGAIDPFVIGSATGALMLVLRTGYTDRDVAAAKLTVMDRLPIRALGAVLNDVREAGAYRLYSYYLPGYGADDEGGRPRRGLPALAP